MGCKVFSMKENLSCNIGPALKWRDVDPECLVEGQLHNSVPALFGRALKRLWWIFFTKWLWKRCRMCWELSPPGSAECFHHFSAHCLWFSWQQNLLSPLHSRCFHRGPQQASLFPSKQALMKPLHTTCTPPKQQTGPVKSRAGRTRQSIYLLKSLDVSPRSQQ